MSLAVNPVTLERARSGDVDARDELVEAWLPTVLGWTSRLGGPKVDAEEAAHDVLLVMVRRMDQVYDAARFGPWLFGITRRTIAQHRRRAWVRHWVPGANPDRADPAGGPAHQYDSSETSREVQRVLESLPEAEREVLVLCLLEERSDREVSEFLGVPVGTIKSRLHRARERFLKAARTQGLGPEHRTRPGTGGRR